MGRTELERRSVYMIEVNAQLRACSQLCGDHPLIRLIQKCLQNRPQKRPSIHEVLGLLEEARAGIRDKESERKKRELVRALETQPRNQVRECTVICCELMSDFLEFGAYSSRPGDRECKSSLSCASERQTTF